MWETPVPIPNTMVKPQTADGTALETVWESRWPPNLKRKRQGLTETSETKGNRDSEEITGRIREKNT